MPSDFPLWVLKPEEAARIIILSPQQPVERHKFWRKRAMRIRPSKRNAPRIDDLKRLSKATFDEYWKQAFADLGCEFPTIGALIGPLLRNGKFYIKEQVLDPLEFANQNAEWADGYSQEMFDWDWLYFEQGRVMLWKRYLDGQTGAGPRIDAMLYVKADNLMAAEQDHCKAKLKMAIEIRARKRKAKPIKIEHWLNIGPSDEVARGFKFSGYDVRKIDSMSDRHWEVKLK